MDKRLFRNEHDKVVAGVSSGLAEYMGVDVTIIRLLFALSTIFLMGTGILVYLIMWIVVPVNYNLFQSSNPFSQQKKTENTGPFQNRTPSPLNDERFSNWKKPEDFKPYKKNNDTGRTVGGLFLLVIGLYFLMDEFHFIPLGFSLRKLWPVVFIAIGISFIIKSKSNNEWEKWKRQNQQDPEQPADSLSEPADPANPETPGNSNDNGTQADDRFTKKDL